jgi:uncharacterized protein YceK
MKKVFLVLAVTATISLSSCHSTTGETTTTGTDSTAVSVDTTMTSVDTTLVLADDTTKVDTPVAKK